MSEEVAERTEAPTSRRRQEARRDGVVARSPDFSGAVVVLTAMIMLAICGGKIFATLQAAVAQSLSSSDISGGVFSREIIYSAAKAIAPVVAVIFIACIAAQILQVGFYFDAGRLRPSFGRSRKKMFQANRLPNGIVNILKIAAIAMLAWMLLKSRIDRITMIQELPISEISAAACSMIYAIAIRLALCLLVIGALDFAYRRYRLEKQLKMTPREAKYEQRLAEGDPKIKARRRQLAMKLVNRKS